MKTKDKPLPYRRPEAPPSPAPAPPPVNGNGKVPSRFDASLTEFLGDLHLREAKEAPIDTKTAVAEWEQVRDGVLRPVFEHAAQRLVEDGRRSSVEVTGDGRLLLRIRMYHALPEVVLESNFKMVGGKVHVALSQVGSHGERTTPASSVTPAWTSDQILRVLIGIVYG